MLQSVAADARALERDVLNWPDVKRIAADRVSRLPRLAPPAGYIVLIQDVEYGSRYKIARHQQLDRHLMKRGADFPFETRVAKIWQAEDAAAAEQDLHDEIAVGTAIGEWFDLDRMPTAAETPTTAQIPTVQRESVSLRDLVQHDGDAESLLGESKIVDSPAPASARPSSPPRARQPERRRRSAAPSAQRSDRRRGRRRGAWAFVVGLLALAGFFAAERSTDVRRVINSLLEESSRPAVSDGAAAPTTRAGTAGARSALPTPEVEGRGEVFVTTTRARVRTCANLNCRILAMLNPDTRIMALRHAKGQSVNGSDRWIVFRFRGQDANIHSSVLSRIRRISEPAPEPSPARQTARNDEAAPKVGATYYTNSRTRARVCARLDCDAPAVLELGFPIIVNGIVSGQKLNGNDRWINFDHSGRMLYIHSDALSSVWPLPDPTVAPSSTAQPTRIKATAVGQGEVFYLRTTAAARSCARSSCEILDLLPSGTKITAIRLIEGEYLDGSELWIRFSYNRRHLSIHSSHLTRTRPDSAAKSSSVSADSFQATSTTGETHYLKTRARARVCPRLDCEVADVFEKGAPISAAGYLRGGRINNNGRWIAFVHNGRNLYFHSGLLTRQAPQPDAAPQPASTKHRITAKPTAEGENEVFYVKTEARARTCTRLTCSEAQLLWPGMRIIALRYMTGQPIDGNDRWIRFINRGWIQYVHSSYLSQEEPEAEPSAETSAVQPSLVSEHAEAEMFYVKPGANAEVRICSSQTCHKVGSLKPGTGITPILVVDGQSVDGNAKWVMFELGSQRRFVHTGDLVPLTPLQEPTTPAIIGATATDLPATAASTATEPPTATETSTERPAATTTATVVSKAKYVVETQRNLNANIRACPRTSCDIVAKFSPGTEVDVVGSVTGETVYETDIWIEISLDGDSAFIHSELVAEEE